MPFLQEELLMRLPKPPFQHPPEVYHAIVREHQDNPMRMAERLQACGWTLADAAWAAVHWNPLWLAAAIADERATRDAKVTSLSETELAKLRVEIGEAKKPAATTRPRKTTRIMRTTPRLTPRPPARG